MESKASLHLQRRSISKDPLLAALGVRYLQIGGDSWNRCNEGWLNVDFAFGPDGLLEHQIGTDDKGAHNMQLSLGTANLPFLSASVQLVFMEHIIEHFGPGPASALMREAYRLLVPGGVLRLATPDLALYMCGYAKPRAEEGDFILAHARRFAPLHAVGRAGAERRRQRFVPSAASVVNNIFRNYGHQWIFDFEEIVRAASDAGIPADAVCRSDRMLHGLPPSLRRAVRRATLPRNRSLSCWLDQQVREDESLYVHLHKPLRRSAEDAEIGPAFSFLQAGSAEPRHLRVTRPSCGAPPGYRPCAAFWNNASWRSRWEGLWTRQFNDER